MKRFQFLTAVIALIAINSQLAAAIDPEINTPYEVRVILRFGEHASLTQQFRDDFRKQLSDNLRASFGSCGNVQVINFNSTPVDSRDPMWSKVDSSGLESLDNYNRVGGPKTHFVFVDFNDGKYQLQSRQHDGSTGFVTPIIRKVSHTDRAFIPRLAGITIANDFGVIGTFDNAGQAQFSVQLRAGNLMSVDQWIQKGDIFAVVQLRENKRASRTKAKGDKQPDVAMASTVADGVLLQVTDTPRDGVCVCRMFSRYKGALASDSSTLGYRCIKLGTTEAPLKLKLVDNSGVAIRGDSIRVRAGTTDFPDAQRDREDLRFTEGMFVSKEPFRKIAFVVVQSGETPIARIPIEIYSDRTVVRKVALHRSTDQPDFQLVANDLNDRVRTARILQVKVFEELSELQKKEKPQALEYGETALNSLTRETDGLKADLSRLKERFAGTAPKNFFDPTDVEIRALEAKSFDLKKHLASLREVIRIENDPATITKRKAIESMLLDAKLAIEKADIPQAIEKYQEALAQSDDNPTAKAEIQKNLDMLKLAWTTKDAEHADARRFIYETWTKLEKPVEFRESIAQARKSIDKCRAVNDRFSVLKFYLSGPQAIERFADNLKKQIEDAKEDEDKKALEPYRQTLEEFTKLITDAGKFLGVDQKK